jgi:hypothetical protein
LIWVEFTKTRPQIVKTSEPAYARRGVFHPLEGHKTDKDINYYFYRANDLQPIRSSIPEAIKTSAANAEEAAGSSKQAATSAERAATSAKDAAQTASNVSAFFRIGLGAAVAAVIAASGILYALVINLHSYFGQIQGNVQTTQALAAGITVNADQAKSDAARAMAGQEDLRREVEAAKAEVETMRNQVLSITHEVEELRKITPPATTRMRKRP